MDDPARAALRRATDASHMRLHAHPAFVALLKGTLSRTNYAELLLRLLGFHSSAETEIARYDHHPLMAWRRRGLRPARSALIGRDLTFLGFDHAAIGSAADAGPPLPFVDNLEAALGCAWVVEGSSLGGAVLGRRLEAVLGSSGSGHGGAFFATGPDHPERWTGCCAAVERCGTNASGYVRMEAASVATFEALEAWLKPPLGPSAVNGAR